MTCNPTNKSIEGRIRARVAVQLRHISGIAALTLLAGCGGGGSGGGAGPAVSAFQTWCQASTNGRFDVRAGVTARITGSQFTPAGVGGFELCTQSGELSRPGTTRVARFELVAPSDWSGRLLFRGGGSFDGVISPFTYSPLVFEHRFAAVATDMGHQAASDASDQSWALNDPDAVADYAFAAIPDVREAAALVLCSHFAGAGVCPQRVYFEGCSTGGREALLAAQRAPDLFDGVIARAPALQWPGLAVAANRIEKRIAVQSLSDAKLATVDAAELAACDALDGASDGVIGRPFDCPFDPNSLRCLQGDAPNCLTDAELETLATVRSPTPLPFAQRDALTEHPAFPMATISQAVTWPLWIEPSTGSPIPALFAGQESFFRYFVAKDPNLDSLAIDPANYAADLAALSTQLDGTSTDLSAFAARGGKLILWHGTIDPAISPLGTIDYFEALQSAAANDPTLPPIEDYARFYIAPGVAHCSGGPGADQVDLLSVLDAWRDGTPPGNVMAHPQSNPTLGDRRLCEWPRYLHYTPGPAGGGTYECRTP